MSALCVHEASTCTSLDYSCLAHARWATIRRRQNVGSVLRIRIWLTFQHRLLLLPKQINFATVSLLETKKEGENQPFFSCPVGRSTMLYLAACLFLVCFPTVYGELFSCSFLFFFPHWLMFGCCLPAGFVLKHVSL